MNAQDDHASGDPLPTVPQDNDEQAVARGEGLSAGLVMGEAARRLQTALDDLSEGQESLAAQLAASQRRSNMLLFVVLACLAGSAWLWYDQADEPTIVLPGQTHDLDRDELAAEVEDLSTQVRNARLERNQHLGETLQLRQQLIDSERRLSELTSGLGQLASQAVPEDEKPTVSVSSTRDRNLAANPAHGVAQALLASGIFDVSIVEHGDVKDGVVYDVLLARHDAQGLALKAETYDRAHLQMRSGVVELVLEKGGAAEGAEIERLPMPAASMEAWASAGLELDAGLVTVAQAFAGLSAVLTGQSIELESLGGFEDGEFLDLVVIERDLRKVVFRSWSAARAELLPEGPVLLLKDGFLEEGGTSRPFWNGHTRLALEGANYDAFAEELKAPATKVNFYGG